MHPESIEFFFGIGAKSYATNKPKGHVQTFVCDAFTKVEANQ